MEPQRTDARLVDLYDVALLDLDGVVYLGPDAVPHARAQLAAARSVGMRLAFVTNNAARPPSVVADHLTRLGIAALAGEVVTSAQAAARTLAEMLEPGAAVLVVGGEGLVQALAERGLTAVRSAEDAPRAVVQGFDPGVGWAQLAEASYVLGRDADIPWVASNGDLTIPTSRGRAPGNGALVETVRIATGRTPVVTGKPEPPMHREAILRTGAVRPLVVGDRLDTDILGATRAGVDSLLVLTGVTDPADAVLAPADQRPTYLARDLRSLFDTASPVRGKGGLGRCGPWKARAHEGHVLIELDDGAQQADPIDGLRAACAAVWTAADGSPTAAEVRQALETLDR